MDLLSEVRVGTAGLEAASSGVLRQPVVAAVLSDDADVTRQVKDPSTLSPIHIFGGVKP